MSRSYEMSVYVSGYNEARENAINQVWRDEWSTFRDLDSDVEGSVPTLSGCAFGSLFARDTPEDFAARLSAAMWKANAGSFCEILISSTFMEDLPTTEHVFSTEAYRTWASTRSYVTPCDEEGEMCGQQYTDPCQLALALP